MPALLAYKTNTPLIVATTIRKKHKYYITYSEPLYPNVNAPKEEEVKRLMDSALALFEEGIKKCPEQWLWIHNRWKQQTLKAIRRNLRHDAIAIFLPENETLVQNVSLFRSLYPTEHITLFVPDQLQNMVKLDAEICPYTHLEEVIKDDLRFKLIFNFTKNKKIEPYYKKRSALRVLHLDAIDQTLETLVKNA